MSNTTKILAGASVLGFAGFVFLAGPPQVNNAQAQLTDTSLSTSADYDCVENTSASDYSDCTVDDGGTSYTNVLATNAGPRQGRRVPRNPRGPTPTPTGKGAAVPVGGACVDSSGNKTTDPSKCNCKDPNSQPTNHPGDKTAAYCDCKSGYKNVSGTCKPAPTPTPTPSPTTTGLDTGLDTSAYGGTTSVW